MMTSGDFQLFHLIFRKGEYYGRSKMKSPSRVGLYDIYVHDLQCYCSIFYTGYCISKSAAEWNRTIKFEFLSRIHNGKLSDQKHKKLRQKPGQISGKFTVANHFIQISFNSISLLNSSIVGTSCTVGWLNKLNTLNLPLAANISVTGSCDFLFVSHHFEQEK